MVIPAGDGTTCLPEQHERVGRKLPGYRVEGAGEGTLRLEVPATAIMADLLGNALTALPYTDGEMHVVEREVRCAGVLALPAEDGIG